MRTREKITKSMMSLLTMALVATMVASMATFSFITDNVARSEDIGATEVTANPITNANIGKHPLHALLSWFADGSHAQRGGVTDWGAAVTGVFTKGISSYTYNTIQPGEFVNGIPRENVYSVKTKTNSATYGDTILEQSPALKYTFEDFADGVRIYKDSNGELLYFDEIAQAIAEAYDFVEGNAIVFTIESEDTAAQVWADAIQFTQHIGPAVAIGVTDDSKWTNPEASSAGNTGNNTSINYGSRLNKTNQTVPDTDMFEMEYRVGATLFVYNTSSKKYEKVDASDEAAFKERYTVENYRAKQSEPGEVQCYAHFVINANGAYALAESPTDGNKMIKYDQAAREKQDEGGEVKYKYFTTSGGVKTKYIVRYSWYGSDGDETTADMYEVAYRGNYFISNGTYDGWMPGGTIKENDVPAYAGEKLMGQYVTVRLNCDWKAKDITTNFGYNTEHVAATTTSFNFIKTDSDYGAYLQQAKDERGETLRNSVTVEKNDYRDTVQSEDKPYLVSYDISSSAVDDSGEKAVNELSAFSFGRINVPTGSYIVLDLNGHTIDRGLSKMQYTPGSAPAVELVDTKYNNEYLVYGSVINVSPKARLEVYDSTAYENATFQRIQIDAETPDLKTDISAGTIKGGFVENYKNQYALLKNKTNHTYKGGAISCRAWSDFVLHSGTIKGNTAHKFYGGGIYMLLRTSVTIFDGYLIGNSADTSYAGGIYLADATSVVLSVYKGVIGYNRSGCGGGIYLNAGTYCNVYGGEISGNFASNEGGGIYLNRGTVGTLEGVTLTGNYAEGNGGGIYVLNDTVNMAFKGALQVFGNYKGQYGTNTTAENVYLPTGATMKIASELISNGIIANVGVTQATPGEEHPFTSGYSKSGNTLHPSNFFHSDNAAYSVQEKDTTGVKEAYLGNKAEEVESKLTWELIGTGVNKDKADNSLRIIVYPDATKNTDYIIYKNGTRETGEQFSTESSATPFIVTDGANISFTYSMLKITEVKLYNYDADGETNDHKSGGKNASAIATFKIDKDKDAGAPDKVSNSFDLFSFSFYLTSATKTYRINKNADLSASDAVKALAATDNSISYAGKYSFLWANNAEKRYKNGTFNINPVGVQADRTQYFMGHEIGAGSKEAEYQKWVTKDMDWGTDSKTGQPVKETNAPYFYYRGDYFYPILKADYEKKDVDSFTFKNPDTNADVSMKKSEFSGYVLTFRYADQYFGKDTTNHLLNRLVEFGSHSGGGIEYQTLHRDPTKTNDFNAGTPVSGVWHAGLYTVTFKSSASAASATGEDDPDYEATGVYYAANNFAFNNYINIEVKPVNMDASLTGGGGAAISARDGLTYRGSAYQDNEIVFFNNHDNTVVVPYNDITANAVYAGWSDIFGAKTPETILADKTGNHLTLDTLQAKFKGVLQAEDAGRYVVVVKVKRDTNYNDYDYEFASLEKTYEDGKHDLTDLLPYHYTVMEDEKKKFGEFQFMFWFDVNPAEVTPTETETDMGSALITFDKLKVYTGESYAEEDTANKPTRIQYWASPTFTMVEGKDYDVEYIEGYDYTNASIDYKAGTTTPDYATATYLPVKITFKGNFINAKSKTASTQAPTGRAEGTNNWAPTPEGTEKGKAAVYGVEVKDPDAEGSYAYYVYFNIQPVSITVTASVSYTYDGIEQDKASYGEKNDGYYNADGKAADGDVTRYGYQYLFLTAKGGQEQREATYGKYTVSASTISYSDTTFEHQAIDDELTRVVGVGVYALDLNKVGSKKGGAIGEYTLSTLKDYTNTWEADKTQRTFTFGNGEKGGVVWLLAYVDKPNDIINKQWLYGADSKDGDDATANITRNFVIDEINSKITVNINAKDITNEFGMVTFVGERDDESHQVTFTQQAEAGTHLEKAETGLSYVYDNERKEPAVDLKYKPYYVKDTVNNYYGKLLTLTQETDYYVYYDETTDATPGEKVAKIRIIGRGNYNGELELHFEIEQAQITVDFNEDNTSVGGRKNELVYTGNSRQWNIDFEPVDGDVVPLVFVLNDRTKAPEGGDKWQKDAYSIEYTYNNDEYPDMPHNGFKNVGTYTVTVELKKDGNFIFEHSDVEANNYKRTLTYNVIKADLMLDKFDDVYYSRAEVEPTVSFTNRNGVLPGNYTVEYSPIEITASDDTTILYGAIQPRTSKSDFTKEMMSTGGKPYYADLYSVTVTLGFDIADNIYDAANFSISINDRIVTEYKGYKWKVEGGNILPIKDEKGKLQEQTYAIRQHRPDDDKEYTIVGGFLIKRVPITITKQNSGATFNDKPHIDDAVAVNFATSESVFDFGTQTPYNVLIKDETGAVVVRYELPGGIGEDGDPTVNIVDGVDAVKGKGINRYSDMVNALAHDGLYNVGKYTVEIYFGHANFAVNILTTTEDLGAEHYQDERHLMGLEHTSYFTITPQMLTFTSMENLTFDYKEHPYVISGSTIIASGGEMTADQIADLLNKPDNVDISYLLQNSEGDDVTATPYNAGSYIVTIDITNHNFAISQEADGYNYKQTTVHTINVINLNITPDSPKGDPDRYIQVAFADKVYDGTAQNATPTTLKIYIKQADGSYDDGHALVYADAQLDVILSVSNNIDATRSGYVPVTVTGTGNFNGTYTTFYDTLGESGKTEDGALRGAGFIIKPREIWVKIEGQSATYGDVISLKSNNGDGWSVVEKGDKNTIIAGTKLDIVLAMFYFDIEQNKWLEYKDSDGKSYIGEVDATYLPASRDDAKTPIRYMICAISVANTNYDIYTQGDWKDEFTGVGIDKPYAEKVTTDASGLIGGGAGIFTILPRSVTYFANESSAEYGSQKKGLEDFNSANNHTEIMPGDDLKITGKLLGSDGNEPTYNAHDYLNVGQYIAYFTYDNPNYVVTFEGKWDGDAAILGGEYEKYHLHAGVYTVTPRYITVELRNSQSYYGDDIVFDYVAIGFISDEGKTDLGISFELRQSTGQPPETTLGGAYPAGTYIIRYVGSSGGVNDNYQVTNGEALSASHTILPRPLGITVTGATGEYGDDFDLPTGISDPRVTITYNGTPERAILDGDVVKLTFTVENISVGAHVNNYDISAAIDNPNYSAPTMAVGKYNITPRRIIATFDDLFNEYGDPLAAVLTDPVFSRKDKSGNAIFGMDSLNIYATTDAAGKGVGKYSFEVQNLERYDDYEIEVQSDCWKAYDEHSFYEVKPREIVISFGGGNSSEYGDNIDLSNYTASRKNGKTGDPVLAGDGLMFSGIKLKNSADNIMTGDTRTFVPGVYTLDLDGALEINPNYKVEFEGGNYTINKRRIQATMSGTSEYGDTQGEISLNITRVSLPGEAIVNGDNLGISVICDVTSATPVGSHPITLNWNNDDRYDLVSQGGNYTVVKREVIITAGSLSMIYGDPRPDATTIKYSASRANGKTGAAFVNGYKPIITPLGVDSTDVGVYDITLRIEPQDDNYNFTIIGAKYEILPRPVTVRILDRSKTYDGMNATVGNVKDVDWEIAQGDLIGNDSLGIGLLLMGNGNNAGKYAIKGDWTNKNYAVTFVGGEYSVLKSGNRWLKEFGLTEAVEGESITADLLPQAQWGDYSIVYYFDAECTREAGTDLSQLRAGTYFVRVFVTDTDNYAGLSSFYTINIQSDFLSMAGDMDITLYVAIFASQFVMLALGLIFIRRRKNKRSA